MQSRQLVKVARILLATSSPVIKLKMVVASILKEAGVNYNQYIYDTLNDLGIAHEGKYNYYAAMESALNYYKVVTYDREDMSQEVFSELLLPGVRNGKSVFDSYMESLVKKGMDPSDPSLGKRYFFPKYFKDRLRQRISNKVLSKNKKFDVNTSYCPVYNMGDSANFASELESKDIIEDIKRRSSSTQREVIEFMLEGASVSEIARKMDTTHYKIRQAIKGLYDIVRKVYCNTGTYIPQK